MAKDIELIYKRWNNLMNLVFSGKLGVDVDDYPSRLESKIQKAVDYKRNGKFEDSIEVYLDIFEGERRIFPGILDMMYKSVICSGRIDFAYEVIAYGEAFAKKAWGPSSWMGPWSQETRRVELELVLAQCSNLPTTFVSEGELTQEQQSMMIDNMFKRDRLIKELMGKYSGGAEVNIPDDVDYFLSRAYQLYSVFRRNGMIK